MFTDQESDRLAEMMNYVGAIWELTKDGEAYDHCVGFLEHEAREFYGTPGNPLDDAYVRMTTHPPKPKNYRSWSADFRGRYERMHTARAVFVYAG